MFEFYSHVASTLSEYRSCVTKLFTCYNLIFAQFGELFKWSSQERNWLVNSSTDSVFHSLMSHHNR